MLEPRLPRRDNSLIKTCEKCGGTYSIEEFAPTHSKFYTDGHCPLCHRCITSLIEDNEWNWEFIDKLCMWLGIPFIPEEWERVRELSGDNASWNIYTRNFSGSEYRSIGWDYYYKQFQQLKEAGLIEGELPQLKKAKLEKMRHRWGGNYDEDELYYLEDLYNGINLTQNVNGALQKDQAQKLCKISLEIDSRIRSGDKDVDKFLSAYDKIVKTAEFTPKNTKDAADFDSVAELALWLEKRGFVNKFYDNVTRDVVDESIKNIESWNQKLYLNEGGIGEEISERANLLKAPIELESHYDIHTSFDMDEYDNEGYSFEEEEFDPGGD